MSLHLLGYYTSGIIDHVLSFTQISFRKHNHFVIHYLCVLIISSHFIILFIYFWLCWVFFAVGRLSLGAVSGGYSSLQCMDFLLQWLLLLRSIRSRRK